MSIALYMHVHMWLVRRCLHGFINQRPPLKPSNGTEQFILWLHPKKLNAYSSEITIISLLYEVGTYKVFVYLSSPAN